MAFKHVLIGAGLVALGVGGFFVLSAKPEVPKTARSPVISVKTGMAEKKSLPLTISTNGYVTAINTVDVRPQIQNVVQSVHVSEGQDVRAGQLLFTLDERNDKANVEKAEAQVARDRADVADAELAYKRNQELIANNFITQSLLDTARNKLDSVRSTLQADLAVVQASRTALSLNKISASMNGRLGTISVHPGSLAQPSGTPMVTISQLDPVAVSFSVPERELSSIRETYPKGDAPITAISPTNKEFQGKLIFIDNTSDAQSGTIKMKAQFANQDRALWPGAFVNIRIISRTLPSAVVIPLQAVVTGPVDKFSYVVQPDSTVKMQKIDVLAVQDGLAAISGLQAGTRIVIEGTQNLRPGSKIKEQQASSAAKKQDAP